MASGTATNALTLEAHLLRKAYGVVVAVDDLSFAVHAGEVVGLRAAERVESVTDEFRRAPRS